MQIDAHPPGPGAAALIHEPFSASHANEDLPNF